MRQLRLWKAKAEPKGLDMAHIEDIGKNDRYILLETRIKSQQSRSVVGKASAALEDQVKKGHIVDTNNSNELINANIANSENIANSDNSNEVDNANIANSESLANSDNPSENESKAEDSNENDKIANIINEVISQPMTSDLIIKESEKVMSELTKSETAKSLVFNDNLDELTFAESKKDEPSVPMAIINQHIPENIVLTEDDEIYLFKSN